jgi:Zn-dependent M28 family amino/carboxypeptidase
MTPDQDRLCAELAADVHRLAGDIGERHIHRPSALHRAADFIEGELGAPGGLRIERQRYTVEGHPCDNLILELPGSNAPNEVVVVGAHYDSTFGSPGANDNASGVAALLALARHLTRGGRSFPRTLRLVAFTNEEILHMQGDVMGSVMYARRCRRRGDAIVAMFCLETMGYYSDVPGSQSYPIPRTPLLPLTGSFIGFVSNLRSFGLLRRSLTSFRRHSSFPCQGAALPSWVPGVSWSDHASFWDQGYPALMITDTAPFRYPHYHRPSDTPDKVDYPCLARVVDGLCGVVRDALTRG